MFFTLSFSRAKQQLMFLCFCLVSFHLHFISYQSCRERDRRELKMAAGSSGMDRCGGWVVKHGAGWAAQ
jgi:hypothetical protein